MLRAAVAFARASDGGSAGCKRVTSPVGATEAIAGAELCHETARPLSGLPTESSTVAVARAFCPMMTAAGVIATRTVATGVGVGGGESPLASPDPRHLPLTALTTASPGATAATTPDVGYACD